MFTSLGSQLKARRTLLGLTQASISDRAGVPRSEISEIEHDKFTGSIKRVEKVANALGMTLTCTTIKRPVYEELAAIFSNEKD